MTHGSRIVATKGDRVMCENEHVIAEFTRDVRGDEDPAMLVDVLQHWRDPRPTTEAMPVRCCICNALWAKADEKGMPYILIEGEWR